MFTKIVLRAFSKDGYHKDILIATNRQVYQNDLRMTDPVSSLHSGLIGHGGRIDPKDFPEMDYFEIVIMEVN